MYVSPGIHVEKDRLGDGILKRDFVTVCVKAI